MRRRPLLAIVGSSVATIAGCSSRNDGDNPSSTDEEPTDKDGSDTPSEADDSVPPEQTTQNERPTEGDETAASISVDLQTVEYVASTYEPPTGRGVNPDDILPEEDIPTVLREALYEARDGTFETDTASEAMLTALDELRQSNNVEHYPYVELDGTNYRFEPTFPTFVAELGESDLDEYDEDRLLREDEHKKLESDAVEEFVDKLIARGTHFPRDEYRRFVRPDAVTDFLAKYDYLEDSSGVSRIETTVRNQEPPFTIELQELTEEDMWGRPVVDEAELDDTLVAFFERALESDHRGPAQTSVDRTQYFTDDVPDAYFEIVEGYIDQREFPYFKLDGTVYSISVAETNYDGVPVTVSIDEHEEGRAFDLTLSPSPENAATDIEDSFTFTSRGALPSVLWVTHGGERYLLDSPDYEKDRWRDAPDDPERDRRPSNQVLETADANEKISATYTVPDELPDGTHVSRGEFNISWSLPDKIQGERAAYPFELLVTVGPSR
jgi:hypothetical protein